MLLADACRLKCLPDFLFFRLGKEQPAGLGEILHGLFRAHRVLAIEKIKVALKIAGHLDIHGGAVGLHYLAQGIFTFCHKAGQQVIFIGGQHQMADAAGQQFSGHKTGKDIPEIAGGHREINHAPLPGQQQRGIDIINDLGHDSRPVDGIDRAQMVLLLEGDVVEQRFDNGLAVVKGTTDRQVEDIGIDDRGHLQFLHGADPLVRMEDEDVDPLLAPHPVNGRAAGIARSGAEDIHFLAAFLEQIRKDIAQKLQGHILEGQGWPMEQLQNVHPALPHQGRDFRMAEGGIGAVDQFPEIRAGNVVNKKGENHMGKVGVGEPLPGGNRRGVHRWHGPGQQEAAVNGQPHHHRLLEGNGGDPAPGADIFHNFSRNINRKIPSNAGPPGRAERTSCLHDNPGRVMPQPFKIIKFPLVPVKDMHHHITVIEEHPAPLLQTFR